MKIEKIVVGSLETNCYILRSDGEAAIIDPGEDGEKIIKNLENENEKRPKVKFVLATHFHWDHADAAAEVVDELDTDFYLGEKDLDYFREANESDLSPDRLLEEDSKIELGDSVLSVWETPGHSPGSITLVEEKGRKLFVGDLIFSTGFGRTDLPGGSKPELEKSLERVVNLDADWEVFPGHGPIFQLKEKINSSPFLDDMRKA